MDSVPELRCRHGLRRLTTGSALPKFPYSVPRGLRHFWRLHWFASATACQSLAPLYGSDWIAQPSGSSYFQAFNGSVSSSVAGYNYNSWIFLLLAGLAPAGMAASFAARSSEVTDPTGHVRYLPPSHLRARLVGCLIHRNGMLPVSNNAFDHVLGCHHRMRPDPLGVASAGSRRSADHEWSGKKPRLRQISGLPSAVRPFGCRLETDEPS